MFIKQPEFSIKFEQYIVLIIDLPERQTDVNRQDTSFYDVIPTVRNKIYHGIFQITLL